MTGETSPPLAASLVTRLRVTTMANMLAKNLFKALHFSMKKTQTSFSCISIIADIPEINEMKLHRLVYCKIFWKKIMVDSVLETCISKAFFSTPSKKIPTGKSSEFFDTSFWMTYSEQSGG